MRVYQELRQTTNSNLYKKLYREYLNKKEGKCSICTAHGGCNETNKWYGTNFSRKASQDIRYPSWKLVSKNRKQWMKKPLKIKTRELKLDKTTYFQLYW
jgi:hypothetical protein